MARIVGGVALLALGIALLVVGINSSHSVADQISNTFIGRFTQTTTWYLIGGVVACIAGLGVAFLGAAGKHGA